MNKRYWSSDTLSSIKDYHVIIIPVSTSDNTLMIAAACIFMKKYSDGSNQQEQVVGICQEVR